MLHSRLLQKTIPALFFAAMAGRRSGKEASVRETMKIGPLVEAIICGKPFRLLDRRWWQRFLNNGLLMVKTAS
jgi:hypothetical protein